MRNSEPNAEPRDELSDQEWETFDQLLFADGAAPFSPSVAGTPTARLHVAALRLRSVLAHHRPTPLDLPAFQSRLQRVLDTDVTRHTTRNVAHRRTRGMRNAGFVGLAGLSFLFAVVGVKAVANWQARRVPQMAAVAAHTYSTTTGQRATVTLSDGTRVTLAPLTSLRVLQDFGGTQRTVQLTGEAYFEVASATGAPFVVRSGHVDTRVLGTAFLIKHYPNAGDVRVTVTTGKVAVARTGRDAGANATILTAGRMALVTDSTTTVSSAAALSGTTGWNGSELTFERVPLSDALATLGRWYGVTFRMADSGLAARHLSGALAHGSVDDMLTTLKNLLDVTLVYDRRLSSTNGDSLIVTLHAKRTGALAPARRPLPPSLPELGR